MILQNMGIKEKLKENQFLYFSKVCLGKDFRFNQKQMRKSSAKTKETIRKEMRLIERYWKCKPLHYIRYGLYDKLLSNEQLIDYIPPFLFYTRYNKTLYKDVNRAYYDNKLNLYFEFIKKGINTIPILAVCNRNRFYDPFMNKVIPPDTLLNNLHKDEKLFVKPINGRGGDGIIVIKKQGNVFYSNGEKVSNAFSELRNNTCYIVQKGIAQRQDLMDINPTSVNTLRVITQWRGDKPSVVVCVLRVGRSGKDVDNSHQGGLSVQINIENGEMFPTATAEHGGGIIQEHPDTHYVFRGKVIKNWECIKNKIENYAEKFTEIKEIAWDVALTEEGVVIIELNIGYGLDHLQCCCGGMRRVLNVYPEQEG